MGFYQKITSKQSDVFVPRCPGWLISPQAHFLSHNIVFSPKTITTRKLGSGVGHSVIRILGFTRVYCLFVPTFHDEPSYKIHVCMRAHSFVKLSGALKMIASKMQ